MLHARIMGTIVRWNSRQNIMICTKSRCQRTRTEHHGFGVHGAGVEHQSRSMQQTARVLFAQDQNGRFVLDLLIQDQLSIVGLVGDRHGLLVDDAVQRPQLVHKLQRVPSIVQVATRNTCLDGLGTWRRQHYRNRVRQHRHQQCMTRVALG